MKSFLLSGVVGTLVSFGAWAQSTTSTTTIPRGNTDVVVAVPPSVVWGAGAPREAENHCMRCCVYENRNYTEGAVVRTEGILLQCARDRQTLGTNTLMWQMLKP